MSADFLALLNSPRDLVSIPFLRSLKKEALQKFLAQHSVNHSSKTKEELVLLCHQTIRLNIPSKSKDDYITRNLKRRTVAGIVYPSPENTSLTWSSNLISVPLIDIFDIQHYLCTESGWTKERFNNRKKENSFKLFSNGHIHGVELCNLENDMLYMSAKCVPETRQSGDSYKLWVLLNKSGQIFSAECNCIACTFWNFAFSTDLHDSAGPSVTDVPAYWTAPKRICKPVAVEDLDIRTDVTTARSDGPTHQDGYFPIPEDQLDKKRIEKDMVKLLKNCKVPGVALYTLSDSDSDLEDIERDNFKNIVDLIRDSGYSSLSEYTHKYKDQIREGTFGQSSNQMWKYQRLGRLTASMFYRAYHYKGGKENNSIVKSCLGKYGDFTTKATQYGIEKEAIARTQYVDKMFNQHTSFLCEETGLHLNPQFPYLGASPDGLVKCKCCQQGVLEIKCPFSMRDLTPEEALTKLPSFRESNGKMELIQNVNSPYYIQMLGQMGICKAPYCDLVLYTTKGIYVERAFFNEALWNNVVLKLKNFYESYILPSILFN